MNNIGLVLCTYNRSGYLKECLDSLKMADLSKINSILIVDDCSTDPETLSLISELNIGGVNIVCHIKSENKSIKDSLLYGYEYFFNNGYETVINLDGDAVVNNQFVDKILAVKNKYPDLIVTGFCCDTLNRDGSIRHKHLYKEKGIVFRESVGGVNLCVNRYQYLKFVKPALIETLQFGGNFDQRLCQNSMKESLPIACVSPSVIQHIGIDSSMNHGAGGEPADTAQDFKLLSLPNVTLILVDDNVNAIIKAADIACLDIEFASVKLLSFTSSNDKRIIPIQRICNKVNYSRFVFDKLVDYIDTEFFMIAQADGYPINAKAWKKEFLSVDFLGARWVWYQDGYDCSNGGFSLRSRRLHQIIKDDPTIVLTNDKDITNYACDHNIGRIYRKYLEEKYDIKYASSELCDQFSIEAWKRVPPFNKYNGSFGFHGYGIDFSDCTLPNKPY